MHVLKFDGTPISKPHSTHLACVIEAYEIKAVVTSKYGVDLLEGFEISETQQTTEEPE